MLREKLGRSKVVIFHECLLIHVAAVYSSDTIYRAHDAERTWFGKRVFNPPGKILDHLYVSMNIHGCMR